MGYFRDSAHFYECVGELMDRAKSDPDVGAKIARSNIVIQFQYKNPEAMTTINAKGKPTQEGAYVDIIHGPCDLKPDVTMSMDADISHRFWHGKVNLMAALGKRQIVARGPIPKILKLLPAVQPLYDAYPKLLAEKGYDELIIK